jgi:hypothetical protein
MATSANVINYTIFKDGKEVGSHRQNVMCKRCNDGLEKYQPSKDYTISAWGYDEDEDIWEDNKQQNLEDWLLKNPGEFTHKKFEVGDNVFLNKKRGSAKILKVISGIFTPSYLVELSNGDNLEITNSDIRP